MKGLDKFNLVLFSIIILVISILICFLQFGWININLALDGVSFLVDSSTAGNISLGLAIILILLSIKSIFFNSYSKENQGKDGILLENDNGKLLVSRDTIESLCNAVVKNYETAQNVMTKVELDNENNVSIFITLFVYPDAIIKELTISLQKDIKETIKKSLDLEVKDVNVRIKNYTARKEVKE